MTDYRTGLRLQPTIDWRALFVLSTLIIATTFCAAVVMMHF